MKRINSAGAFLVNALLLSGLGGLAICGWANCVLAAITMGAVLVGRSRERRPSSDALIFWRVANLSAMALCLVVGLLGIPLHTVGAFLVCWLTIQQAWARRSVKGERALVLLAVLGVLLARLCPVIPFT